MAGKHGPNRFANYQQVHDTRMQDFLREGFVLAEDLRFEDIGSGFITLTGTVRCLGGIILEVDKLLTVLEGSGAQALVQTAAYRYHAFVAGGHNILRYDGPHPDHNAFHHVHRYENPGSGREVQVDEVPTEDAIPTLSEVLDELRDWYYAQLEAQQCI